VYSCTVSNHTITTTTTAATVTTTQISSKQTRTQHKLIDKQSKTHMQVVDDLDQLGKDYPLEIPPFFGACGHHLPSCAMLVAAQIPII